MVNELNTLLSPLLAERFLASCQQNQSDSQQILRELVEEYLSEIQAGEIALERLKNPGNTISLEEMMHRCGLAN